MRRLPIFLVLDVSESMAGDNLRQVGQGLEKLVGALRQDPHALETVYLSSGAHELLPASFAGRRRHVLGLSPESGHGRDRPCGD